MGRRSRRNRAKEKQGRRVKSEPLTDQAITSLNPVTLPPSPPSVNGQSSTGQEKHPLEPMSSPERTRLCLQKWQLAVAAFGIIVAASLTVSIYLYNAQKQIANIEYQYGVQPDPFSGNDWWLGWILVSNRGPATAKTFVMHVQVPPPTKMHTLPPKITEVPGAEVKVTMDGHGDSYAIAVNNLTPANGFAVYLQFRVPLAVVKEMRASWDTNMFKPKFINQFIRWIVTTGENIHVSYEGISTSDPQGE
jgi:hypothetical protein